MKKFIVILLSTIFVLGLAASVYATELKFGGDAYVEGVWRDQYDFSVGRNTDDDYRYWGERVRLKFDAVLENGIEVRTRLRVQDGIWDGAAQTKLGDTGYAQGASPIAGAFTSLSTKTSSITPDYAYLHVPIGPVTVDVGHQLLSWGDKFWVWDAEVDMLELTGKIGDNITLGAFTLKNTELLQGDAEGDQDSYAAFIVAKLGDASTLGFIHDYTQNQPNNSADHPLQDGHQMDAFFNTKVGPVSVFSEFAVKTGFMFATNNNIQGWNNQFGGFAAAAIDLAPVTLVEAFAIAGNGFVTDNDFTPTYFFGTMNNPLAIMDFQSLCTDRTTWALVSAANFQATDALSVGGKMAYAWFGVNDNDLNGDAATPNTQHHDYFSIFEMDGTVKYQIAKSTTYEVGAAIGIPTHVPAVMGMSHDPNYGMFHKLSISF